MLYPDSLPSILIQIDLFCREIAFYRDLDTAKVEITSEYDFTPYDAFNSIDIYETGFVDYYNLKNFLKGNGKKPGEDLLIAILRRFDKDDDGRISFEEFAESIQPMDPTFTKSMKKKRKSFKTEETLRKSTTLQQTTSPSKLLRSTMRTTSPNPKKFLSPEKHIVQSQYLKKEKLKPSYSMIMKKSTATPGRKKSVTKERLTDTSKDFNESRSTRESDAYGDLLKVFREVINLEREVEFAKQDLALRNDFNPFDAFRYFDKKGKTFISVAEMEEGFSEIGIYPNKEDLYLFIRRFDKQGDGKLR
jgi:Ca2+-binding EF-hand superfamily protein